MRKKAYFKSVTIFLSILLVFSQLQLFSLPAYGETVSDQPLLFRSVVSLKMGRPTMWMGKEEIMPMMGSRQPVLGVILKK